MRRRMPAEAVRRSALLPRSGGVVAALVAATLAAPCGAATVQITVSGVSPNGGSVLTSLCQGGLDRAACARGQNQPADGSVLTFLFPDIEPGRYAALAFQDLEGDGVLQRSRMGRPLEPYGISNGAGRLRRPTFEQAAVSVGPGGARIAIRLVRSGSP